MKKQTFKQYVLEGLDRNKEFMILKIKSESDVNPRVIIVQGADIQPTAKRYLELTDDNMIFKDSGDRITDALLTSNLNDLSWFAY